MPTRAVLISKRSLVLFVLVPPLVSASGSQSKRGIDKLLFTAENCKAP